MLSYRLSELCRFKHECNSQPAYSVHIYSAVISCEHSHVLTAAPMQKSSRNSKFTHGDEMTASPTFETQKFSQTSPHGRKTGTQWSYVGTLRDVNTANTSSMTKHWVCPNTVLCVCVFVSGRSSQADPETWLQLLIKSYRSDLWPLRWDIYRPLSFSNMAADRWRQTLRERSCTFIIYILTS